MLDGTSKAWATGAFPVDDDAVSPIRNRPQSPHYNSDSEVSRRRSPSNSAFSPVRGCLRKSRREPKSANLNELIKLVSLHESLLNSQNQLHNFMENCNRLIEEDCSSALRRESSEREYQLQYLQEQKDSLDDAIKLARADIASWRKRLCQQRVRLAEAQALHEDDLLTEFDAGIRLAEEKKRVQSLRIQIDPVQTSLLSTLAFTFPIELLSPPDLLYTILGVPLPIPLQGSDPAPPLSLPHMPAVSEDGIASALGYAALLSQHREGSNLCDDGSADTFRFPLYSKGVDTYQFEYTVFLLNKNIEMVATVPTTGIATAPRLCCCAITSSLGGPEKSSNKFFLSDLSERLRHLSSPSVVSIPSGLQSPSPFTADSGNPEPPPLTLESDDAGSSTTPKGRAVGLPSVDVDDDAASVADSGSKDAGAGVITSSGSSQDISNAPSTSMNKDRSGGSSGANTLRPRLPRIQIQSYLGLAPLSSMWKGRGASSSSVSSSRAAETSETAPQEEVPELTMLTSANSDEVVESDDTLGSGEDEEDEEDRRTVRGSSVPTTPTAGTRPRRGSIAPDGLFENLKDLKARVHPRGSNNIPVNAKVEKHPEPVEDRDAVVDPAC
ncbi:hypothetical protein J3R30DRAFT_3707897 [Lentinula aciculospora]|uniref:Uncharacterized protein n=1 Tax=Lentinula aciculospora TaxID=153920 RepID=A0A9W9DKF6_9AGAR|nr:hypothetical protein J3R30DRAFT_3707897 [Lentinula aciculospora]